MTYPGGKDGNGVYQAIINQIPPHTVFIEGCAGGAAITRHMKPSDLTILIELDCAQAKALIEQFRDRSDVDVHNTSCMTFFEMFGDMYAHAFCYFDPPYVMESRRSQRPIYNHEWTTSDHIEFLQFVRKIPNPVAVSGYHSDLYMEVLKGWRCITFKAQTRQGQATEYLWMNYDEPLALHDVQYLGADYRERENIKKRCQRWAANFKAMTPLERQAVLSTMLGAIRSDTAENGGKITPAQMAVLDSVTDESDGAAAQKDSFMNEIPAFLLPGGEGIAV